jgi:hypothetical protein
VSSFIVKHWHGRFSLPISFWVNGVVLTLVLNELITNIPWGRLAAEYPKSCSSAVIFLWLLLLPFATWQLWGIWRSATAYLRDAGPTMWGHLAKLIVVVAAVRIALEIGFIGVPQLIQHGQLAVGRDPLGSYELHVIHDGTELEANGVIAFGITRDVRNLLNANPRIDTIQLNSNGGRTIEARRLRDLIDAKGLTTSTSQGCSSACTLAFVAGKRRLITRNARLGFHRYSFPGISEADLQRQYEIDKDDWRSRGLNAALINRAFSTSEIWAPDSEDLLKWGVVTGFMPSS